MDKRTELEIQRDKDEAVIEERDALISSLRGENEKLKRDLEEQPKYSLTLIKVKPNRRLSGTQSGL